MPYILGFNDAQKMRVNLSSAALTTIEEDMEIFDIKSKSEFINTVFINYRETAKVSITTYMKSKETEIESSLSDCNFQSSTKEDVVSALLQKERSIIEDQITQYKKKKGVSNLYHINKQNTQYLLEDCPESEDGIYPKPGLYIKCVLEEYCSLPFIERERIFNADVFHTVEDACSMNKMLKIKVLTHDYETIFHAKPYGIIPDPMGTQSYLVCESYPASKSGEPLKAPRIASFNMARLKYVSILRSKPYHFKAEDITKIEKILSETSPAFLLYDTDEVRVRLTPEGIHIFHVKLFSRPVPDKILSTENEYVFHCTHQQIYNYFFNFGQNVEIISPESLRRRFAEEYKKALQQYN